VVEVQRIWLIGDGKPENGGARVSLRQTDSGDFALSLGPLGSDGLQGGQEIDLDVARALAQAMLEACEVAAALEQ
jgi:hypothetical protein